jgi:hypothetical protein
MIRRLASVLAVAIAAALALPTSAQQPLPGQVPAAAPSAPATQGPPTAPPLPQAAPTASSAPSVASPAPVGSQLPSAQPSGSPAAAASAAPALLQFTGQLLDDRNGYIFFTTGDAFKLGDAPRIVDYTTGQPTTLQPAPKLFAQATLDPATHQVVQLALTQKRLPTSTSYESMKQYAVVKSTPLPAPEIVGQRLTGKEVPVVFLVEVPPNTPLTADVYISTDASGWNPQAIKLDRVDGMHYRTTRRFASGTKFAYRVTRGTWQTEEIGENGLEPTPHEFFVREVDAQVARATVYSWADLRPNQTAPQPGAIPTPFNPNPFPGGPGAIAPHVGPTSAAFPTPNPNIPPNQPPGH